MKVTQELAAKSRVHTAQQGTESRMQPAEWRGLAAGVQVGAQGFPAEETGADFRSTDSLRLPVDKG